MKFTSKMAAPWFTCERSRATPKLACRRNCDEGHSADPRTRNRSPRCQRLCGRYKSQDRHGLGEVFTADVDGGRSVVPGAKISLIGPATRETEADAAGKYVFDALPPGSYDLKAQAPGMIATHTLNVEAKLTVPGIRA